MVKLQRPAVVVLLVISSVAACGVDKKTPGFAKGGTAGSGDSPMGDAGDRGQVGGKSSGGTSQGGASNAAGNAAVGGTAVVVGGSGPGDAGGEPSVGGEPGVGGDGPTPNPCILGTATLPCTLG